MNYLEYLRKEGLVCECSALLEIEMEQVNEYVRQVLMTAGKKHSANRGSYADYTLEDRATIGKYATENGHASATRHLSAPEMTARSILGKFVKFEKLPITCIFLAKLAKFLCLSNFPCYTVNMSTDIIVTAKYTYGNVHVLQRSTRLWI